MKAFASCFCRRIAFLACIGVLSALTGVAKADTFTSYRIQSTLADGGTFNAVFSFDSTNVFGSTLVGLYATATCSGLINETVGVLGSGVGATQLGYGTPQGQIDIFYPGPYPSPFNGTLCVYGASVSGCGTNFSDVYNSTTRSFDYFTTATTVAPLAVAATPEPGSLALLSTGLIGVAETVRRKYRSA